MNNENVSTRTSGDVASLGKSTSRQEETQFVSLAKAKVEQVVEIIEIGQEEGDFDVHDARWCLKLLSEAFIALLP